jgi:molybdopterin-guanine dinucleotide biosynthesis protein A
MFIGGEGGCVVQHEEAVIFAGGRSTRMGRDKALLPYGGYSTLAEYQYRRLAPYFARVNLSAKTDKFPFDVPVVCDLDAASSPIVALKAVLAQTHSEAVFVLSVDMPGVDSHLIDRLYKALNRNDNPDIVVARSSRGTEPLCAIYRRTLLPRIEAMVQADNHRMHDLLHDVCTAEVFCERDEIFVNLNTPEEYRRHMR